MACSLNLTESLGLSLLPNLRHAIQVEAITPLEELTQGSEGQNVNHECGSLYVYIDIDIDISIYR